MRDFRSSMAQGLFSLTNEHFVILFCLKLSCVRKKANIAKFSTVSASLLFFYILAESLFIFPKIFCTRKHKRKMYTE